MTTEEYKKLMGTRPYLEAGTEAYDCMHRMAAAAQAVTASIIRRKNFVGYFPN